MCILEINNSRHILLRMAMSLTATEILDQVYACRERDLLRRISDAHNLDYDIL